jgi:hypothetical protein
MASLTSDIFLVVLDWRSSRLFKIEGVVTFAVAVVAVYLLPDSPLTTRWLAPEERALAFERIARDTVGLAPNNGAIAGFKQAFGD